ncbi:MAG: phosphosulfolactate synthase [Candidatus Syntropharchaeales archaeon]
MKKMISRDDRVTMMLDKGIGLRVQADTLDTAVPYITMVKIGWGIGKIIPDKILKEKVSAYKNAGLIVSPGGTALEKAILQDELDIFFAWLKSSGFNAVEVSNGVIEIGEDEKCDLIHDLRRRGFTVLSEVGSKDPLRDREITIEDRCDAIQKELDAGSWKVIVEAREGGKGIGFFDDRGNILKDELSRFLKIAGWKDIIFEAPLKSQQVFFIKEIGADVNLGNIPYDEILPLETLRQGLRGDTLKLL